MRFDPRVKKSHGLDGAGTLSTPGPAEWLNMTVAGTTEVKVWLIMTAAVQRRDEGLSGNLIFEI